MLKITVRKMLSNKWVLACSLLGAIITVAVLSSIPIYTNGIMQRMLTKNLESSQSATGKFPGGYLIKYNTYPGNENDDLLKSIDKKITGTIEKSIKLPLLTKGKLMQLNSFKIKDDDSKRSTYANLCSLSDIKNHIKILHGRLNSEKINNGEYEVIASEEAAKVLDITLGNSYTITNRGNASFNESKSYKIKVVGLFTYKSTNDPYWFSDIGTYKDNVFIDPGLLEELTSSSNGETINNVQWFFAYDYYKIKIENLKELLDNFKNHDQWFSKSKSYLDYERPMDSVIDQYNEKVKQLNITLVVLEIPIFVILAFYLFMIAKLKIDFESNEIAVMKSRGSSSIQIFTIYFIETTVINIIAIATGPLLGLYMCKILGASDGFLEFVERRALPLSLGKSPYLYSLVAVLFIYICTLIPALIASRTTIVLYKQKGIKKDRNNSLKGLFIDIILLALVIYGLFGYNRQQKFLLISGVKGTDLSIDPLIYILSVLFIFGSGRMLLRLFPYFIRFVFYIGKKIWNPVFYASLNHVSNDIYQSQFAMFFLILTLSIGIFSANSARTINKNMEEKIRYEVGADIVVQGHWTNNQASSANIPGLQTNTNRSELLYYEPPFEQYTKLAGLQSVTKVFKQNSSKVVIGSTSSDNVPIMGIIPYKFGKTAWFKSDLLPHHWYEYLNLMTDAPEAVLVSRAFQENYNAKVGDIISVSWGDRSFIEGIIYAFIDYWPSLNPNTIIEGKKNPYFVVANLDYIQAKNIVEPYQVWLKKKTGVTSNQIYKEITKNKIELESTSDSSEKIIQMKNDPMLQGTNGSLTLGFIVIVLITFTGFLIYWILSIKKRALNFGIFRAMGLTKTEVTGMLICEQFLVTGVAVLAGMALGNIASRLFIPLFQLAYSSAAQVPPFKVISALDDYLRLYGILGIMLIVCLFIIWRFISKLNMGQALKLGED